MTTPTPVEPSKDSSRHLRPCSEFFKHVRSLGFESKPDYAYLRGLLIDRMEEMDREGDVKWIWDWVDQDRIDSGDTLFPEHYGFREYVPETYLHVR